MAAYLSALLVCMKPLNLLLIFAMVALGIVFGAIPGLSATLGIALLLPITFGLSTETSFVMLLAIWIGGVVLCALVKANPSERCMELLGLKPSQAYLGRLVFFVVLALMQSTLILLGDLLYHGPRNPLRPDYAPPEVVPMLNAEKERIIAVRGNCDSEVDQMLLEFPIMADFSTLYVDGIKFFLTHGIILLSLILFY